MPPKKPTCSPPNLAGTMISTNCLLPVRVLPAAPSTASAFIFTSEDASGASFAVGACPPASGAPITGDAVFFVGGSAHNSTDALGLFTFSPDFTAVQVTPPATKNVTIAFSDVVLLFFGLGDCGGEGTVVNGEIQFVSATTGAATVLSSATGVTEDGLVDLTFPSRSGIQISEPGSLLVYICVEGLVAPCSAGLSTNQSITYIATLTPISPPRTPTLSRICSAIGCLLPPVAHHGKKERLHGHRVRRIAV